jgi:tRNA threonylcarbamoyladenosine biosynthesis protein TsaB
VLAALDARRGEAYAAAWDAAGAPLAPPAALAPEALGALAARVAREAGGAPLAVGDGAVRFRDRLGAGIATVPEDASPLHRVDGAALCRLAAERGPVAVDALLPAYVRAPDARPSARRGAASP